MSVTTLTFYKLLIITTSVSTNKHFPREPRGKI